MLAWMWDEGCGMSCRNLCKQLQETVWDAASEFVSEYLHIRYICIFAFSQGRHVEHASSCCFIS